MRPRVPCADLWFPGGLLQGLKFLLQVLRRVPHVSILLFLASGFNVHQGPIQVGQVFWTQSVAALAADQLHFSFVRGDIENEVQLALYAGSFEPCRTARMHYRQYIHMSPQHHIL
jgi:hypothetical protein